MSNKAFYDSLAPLYHLIYDDWEASIQRQARGLDSVIRAAGFQPPSAVLDAACGIGTQALGLAALGYTVTASDLSPKEVERATAEADQRGLSLACSVVDMRRCHDHHQREFDVVIACDNAVPHLLTDEEIRRTFDQFFRCTAPGGLCVISVRDYASAERSGVQVHPYRVREIGGIRYVPLQVWEWESERRYHTTMYIIEHQDGLPPVVHSMRATYNAVSIDTLIQLMSGAGFAGVERLDEPFFQPLIVGRRPPTGVN